MAFFFDCLDGLPDFRHKAGLGEKAVCDHHCSLTLVNCLGCHCFLNCLDPNLTRRPLGLNHRFDAILLDNQVSAIISITGGGHFVAKFLKKSGQTIFKLLAIRKQTENKGLGGGQKVQDVIGKNQNTVPLAVLALPHLSALGDH